MNLYSCFFKTKSKEGKIEYLNTRQPTHCIACQQLLTPLIPYAGECRMLLGFYALVWIASQEAFPLTCTGLFKANIYVICRLRSPRFRENGKRGSCAYMVLFFFFSCSCRMSATQCLKHEWLNNLPAKAKRFKLRLKSQLLLQSYIAQRKWKVISLENLLPGENQLNPGRFCFSEYWLIFTILL